MEFPKELLYTRDYSWMKVERGIAILGVVGPATKIVREFVFVSLPKNGARVQKGDTYISLESMKWSGHLSSPVSGEVIDVNERVYDDPALINREPYKSWIVKIKMGDPEEKKGLTNAFEAKKWFQKKHGGG